NAGGRAQDRSQRLSRAYGRGVGQRAQEPRWHRAGQCGTSGERGTASLPGAVTMNFFSYKHGELHAEDVSLAGIAAQVGTPFYCSSAAALRAAWQEFADGIKGMRASICYAMKANSSLAVVRLFGELGAGADIVSVGEMHRALAAGIPASRIVY